MIFCKNCKYRDVYGHACGHPNNIKTYQDYNDSYTLYDRRIETINGQNDCKWFKRVWWMFWLKKEVN
jgi:hypothetical protein